MARFLANIADLTRLESGEVRPRLAPVPVAGIVDAALARLPDLAGTSRCASRSGARALADPALLEQALFNVLDNAVKYAPAGSLLRIRGVAERGEVRLSVMDEGVGIAPEDLPHVFDSFFRARPRRPGGARHRARACHRARAGGGDGRPRRRRRAPTRRRPRGGLPGTVVTLSLPKLSTRPAAATR